MKSVDLLFTVPAQVPFWTSGQFTEGIMAGKDPLSFIPFNRGADDRAGGKVSVWVHSWWETKKGTPFGGFPLRNITKDNMFELRDLKAARLGMMPPAAMEVVLELLCEDPFSQPPVAPCVCCSPFDDTSLEEGLDEERGPSFHSPSTSPILDLWAIRTSHSCCYPASLPCPKIHRTLGGQGN